MQYPTDTCRFPRTGAFKHSRCSTSSQLGLSDRYSTHPALLFPLPLLSEVCVCAHLWWVSEIHHPTKTVWSLLLPSLSYRTAIARFTRNISATRTCPAWVQLNDGCLNDRWGNSHCFHPASSRVLSSACKSRVISYSVAELPCLIYVQGLVFAYLHKAAKGTQRTRVESLHSNTHANILRRF